VTHLYGVSERRRFRRRQGILVYFNLQPEGFGDIIRVGGGYQDILAQVFMEPQLSLGDELAVRDIVPKRDSCMHRGEVACEWTGGHTVGLSTLLQ
jgi:hypothetical protein